VPRARFRAKEDAVGAIGAARAKLVVEPRLPLSARVARALPLTLWLTIVGLALVELWMIAVTLGQPAPGQWGFRGFEGVLALSFGTVGAFIAARRPENRFGWLLLAVSVVAAVQGLIDQYPVLARAADPPLAGGVLASWIAAWIWVIPSVAFMVFIPLLFPNGRLLSRRWGVVVALAFAVMAVQAGLVIAASQPFGPVPPSADPTPYFDRIGPAMAVGYVFQFATTALAVTSGFVRYRRASRDERQQLKWVAFAGFFVPFAMAAGFSGIFIGQLTLIASALFAAAALAIAILRYRLYEIDVIINRTLVYGALTAILAGIYTASITLSQRVFTAITGESSDAAIVFTTLIVVTLFTPIKTRLQAIFDARLKPARVRARAGSEATPVEAIPATAVKALDVLARLALLRESGGLTTSEYRRAKARLLPKMFETADVAAGADQADTDEARGG
jgi:hypothetical protein